MMRRSERWLLAGLALWVLTPVLLLVFRALAPSWRYPQILPDASGLLSSPSTVAVGRLASAMGTSLLLVLCPTNN